MVRCKVVSQGFDGSHRVRPVETHMFCILAGRLAGQLIASGSSLSKEEGDGSTAGVSGARALLLGVLDDAVAATIAASSCGGL